MGEHERHNHCCLYDDTLKVPLVIALEGRIRGGGVIPAQVRSVDILPTVLELVGQEVPEGIDGVSLLPLLDGGSMAPLPAWSYARFQGVSARIDNRLKYIFYNHPWAPDGGGEELYDLRRDPAELSNVISEAQSPSVREDLLKKLLQRPGLRIDLRNSSQQEYSGTIRAQQITKAQLKCFPFCSEVVWRGAQEVEFAVPPGRSYSILLESGISGELTIAGGFGNAPGFSFSADLAQLSQSSGVSVEGSLWSDLEPGSPAPPTGIMLSWQGGGRTPRLAEHDEELRQQLRALGYIN